MVKFLQIINDYASNKRSIKNQEKFLNDYSKYNRDYYDRQMSNATNLFNRQYYSNYLDTPTAQNMLNRLRKQLDEQNRSLRNTAQVMGLTGESYAAMQKNNNKIMENVVGRLSVADAQQKERALNNYINTYDKYNDMMYQTGVDELKKRLGIEESKNQLYSNTKNMTLSTILDMIMKK